MLVTAIPVFEVDAIAGPATPMARATVAIPAIPAMPKVDFFVNSFMNMNSFSNLGPEVFLTAEGSGAGSEEGRSPERGRLKTGSRKKFSMMLNAYRPASIGGKLETIFFLYIA